MRRNHIRFSFLCETHYHVYWFFFFFFCKQKTSNVKIFIEIQFVIVIEKRSTTHGGRGQNKVKRETREANTNEKYRTNEKNKTVTFVEARSTHSSERLRRAVVRHWSSRVLALHVMKEIVKIVLSTTGKHFRARFWTASHATRLTTRGQSDLVWKGRVLRT